MLRMSLRQIVWTATFLVVAFPFVYMGTIEHRQWVIQEATQSYDAALRKHARLTKAEEPRALERFGRIRAELAAGNVPDWAGEYSWTNPGAIYSALSGPTSDGEGIALAPESGAVWWHGGSTPDSAALIDHGRVMSANEEHVVVEWTIDPKDPHRNGVELPVRLLCDELVRVKWNGGEFLVPAVRMPMFCSTMRATMMHVLFLAPRKGGWVVRDDKHQFHLTDYSSVQAPVVPPAWNKYILSNPITANASLDSSPEIVYRRLGNVDAYTPPAWWHWPPWQSFADYRDGIVRVRYALKAGTNQGVFAGMPIFMPNDDVSGGVVVDASSTSAHVDYWTFGSSFDSTQGPPNQVTLSTAYLQDH
jgi:hypothetical protein